MTVTGARLGVVKNGAKDFVGKLTGSTGFRVGEDQVEGVTSILLEDSLSTGVPGGDEKSDLIRQL